MTGLKKIERPMTKGFDVYKIKFNVKIEDVKRRSSYGKSHLDWNDLLNKVYENVEYNARILDLVMKNLGYKIMILTQRVAHAEILGECLEKAGVDVCVYTGKCKTYKDARVLISTVSKGGTGLDQLSAQGYTGERINLLLWIGSTKLVKLLEQCFGRALRSTHPTIFYVMPNHPSFESHYRIAKKWLKTMNARLHE